MEIGQILGRTGRGIAWSFAERFSVTLAQFLFSIFLARILGPGDYGLVAMISVFVSLAQALADSGFGNALVRSGTAKDSDYSTVFLFNVSASLALYAVLYVCAPLIAHVYGRQELVSMVRISSLSVIIYAAGSVQRVRLTRAVDFRRLAMASFAATLFSGIGGLVLALRGLAAMSLVWSGLINSLVQIAVLWIVSPWRPRLIFDPAAFRTMGKFGSGLLAANLIDTAYRNYSRFLFGAVSSGAALGVFVRADSMASLPATMLTGIVNRVWYPVLASITDDHPKLEEQCRRFARSLIRVIVPLLLGCAVLAEPIVRIVLGEKWMAVVPLFRILCLGYTLQPLTVLNLTLLMAEGHSARMAGMELVKKAVGIFVLSLAIPRGALWTSVATSCLAVFNLAINSRYTGRFISYSLIPQLVDFGSVALLSGAAAWFGYYLCGLAGNGVWGLMAGVLPVAGVMALLWLAERRKQADAFPRAYLR